MTTPVVRLRGAGRAFGSTVAVADVDLRIDSGERVAILGSSGAGKTTLLAMINGSLSPTSGCVEIFGSDLAQLSSSQLRQVQRRIGSISQRLDLVEQVRVLHNVNAGRLGQWSTVRSLLALVSPRPDSVVLEALERVGLAWAVHERTERLSGGERQRVAIARMLVQFPDLVVADEPVSSLDPRLAGAVLELLQQDARGQLDGRSASVAPTIVASLHQPELARIHCTRAIGLREGRIAFDVPTEQLSTRNVVDLYSLT